MLRKGQKAMLHILKEKGRTSKIKMMKLLFLMNHDVRPYDFVPYNYGPFSFQMYHEVGNLEKDDIISTSKRDIWINNEDKCPEIGNIDIFSETDRCLDRYGHLTDNELLDFIYDRYPEYSIFSKISKRMDYKRDEKGITTIGYEGKSIDSFLKELIDNKVSTLVDVRRNAFSMKFGFSKTRLESYCEKLRIHYIHIPELGIESRSRKKLNTYEDYQRLFAEYDKELEKKEQELERILELSRSEKVSLMCFEKDVHYCHRGRIAQWLREKGMEVQDI